MMRAHEKGKGKEADPHGPASSTTSLRGANQHSPSDPEFSLDGSAVWVENHPDQLPHLPSSIGSTHTAPSSRSTTSSVRGRKSTDASSTSSTQRREDRAMTPAPNAATPVLKDTHYFPATIDYNDHQLPIRLPVYTFPEEVGDVGSVRSLNCCHPSDQLSTAVLAHPARADVLQSICVDNWSSAPASAHKWQPDASYHNPHQRTRYRETYNFPRASSSCRPSVELRVISMRPWLWVRDSPERLRQAGLPVREPDEQGGMGVNVSTSMLWIVLPRDDPHLYDPAWLMR